eukprot:1825460-Prymnesium_polylepis.1
MRELRGAGVVTVELVPTEKERPRTPLGASATQARSMLVVPPYPPNRTHGANAVHGVRPRGLFKGTSLRSPFGPPFGPPF